jgi:predicted amidohydrolase YtcJ
MWYPDAGGALLPGLHDHHIHLLATAARAGSVDVSPAHAPDRAALARILGQAARQAGQGGTVRAVGYDDEATGRVDAAFLDRAGGGVAIRIQHRGGHAWVLSTTAGRAVGAAADGWLFGADALPPAPGPPPPGLSPPGLADLGRRLAGYGVTGVTDAGPGNDSGVAGLLVAARDRGELAQHVTLLGRAVPPDGGAPGITRGADKIVLEEFETWSLTTTRDRIQDAHRAGRRVAVHCVTGAAVVFALTAFDDAGVLPGDRLEHASVVAADLIPRIAHSGLAVVTQPAFTYVRGDDYLARVDSDDLPGLYRVASLLSAGVAVAGSSDGPFGPDDPWLAMRTAVSRRTASGQVLGAAERVSPEAALGLYIGPSERPGGAARRVSPGAPADLCLLRLPWREARVELTADLVAATVIAGELVHDVTGR